MNVNDPAYDYGGGPSSQTPPLPPATMPDPLIRINPRNYLRDEFTSRLGRDPKLLGAYENNPRFKALITMLYRGRDDSEIIERMIMICLHGEINIDQIPNLAAMIERAEVDANAQKGLDR